MLGWLIGFFFLALLLSQLVAVLAGMLLLVTLAWWNLLSSTEVQLRLLLAVGVMTLGLGQLALFQYLTGFPSLSEESSEEEDLEPAWVLPSSEFFAPKRRRRRPRKK